MTFRGLIFDFDGTILDTEFPEFQVWQDIFASYNASLHVLDWAKCLGTTFAAFDPLDHLRKQTDRPFDPQEIMARRQECMMQKVLQQPILPGVEDYLQEAQKIGMKLGVASSSERRWVQGHLERLHLSSFFHSIVTAEDVKEVKPEPDLFLKALEELELKPDEAIILEDSPNGIKAAHKAGIRCVAIPNQVSQHLDLSQADLIINSLEEMTLKELILHFNDCRENLQVNKKRDQFENPGFEF